MSKTQTVPVRCELKFFCDTPEQAAQAASAIAAATGRGVETEAPIPGPTVRDAVAGMLLRFGFRRSADRLARDGWSPADLVEETRSPVSNPDRDVCIAAREACRAGHGVNDACAECAPGEQGEGVREEVETLRRALDNCSSRRQAALLVLEKSQAETEELRKRVADLEAGKAENERLRAEVSRLDAALTRREEDVARVSLERDKLREEGDSYREERDAFQMSTEEGFEVAARLRKEANEAREAGAAEMRERAASLALDWEPHEGLEKLAERIMGLPIGGDGTEQPSKDAARASRWQATTETLCWQLGVPFDRAARAARIAEEAGVDPEAAHRAVVKTAKARGLSMSDEELRLRIRALIGNPELAGGPETAARGQQSEITAPEGVACDGSGMVADYGGPFDCAGCAGCHKASAPGDVRAAQDAGGGPFAGCERCACRGASKYCAPA